VVYLLGELTVSFLRWTTLYARLSNWFIEVSRPYPPEEAFTPRMPRGENEIIPHQNGVYQLGNVAYNKRIDWLRRYRFIFMVTYKVSLFFDSNYISK